MNDDQLLDFLGHHGFTAHFDDRGWVECLLVAGHERWLGRGGDEAEALHDAIGQMAPSRLTRQVLQQALQRWCEGQSDDDDELTDDDEPEAGVQAAVDADDEPAVEQIAPTVLRRATPAVRPAPLRVREERVIRDGVAPTVTSLADRAERARAAQEARDRLSALQEEIQDAEEDLGRMAPERIRLELLHWIASARGIQQTASHDPEVERLVRDIANRLGQLAKQLWPGTVRALRLDAEPEGALQGHARGSGAHTWAEVAVQVEAILDELMGEDDRDGWDDGAGDAASPDDARREMREISDLVGPLLVREPDASSVDTDTIADWAMAAARLRWVRPQSDGVDGAVWGRMMGALRRIVRRLGPEAGTLRKHLDPTYAPPRGWKDWIRSKTNGAHQEALLETRPSADATNEQVWAWVRQGIEHLGTPDLAPLLGDLAARVLALEEADLPNPDRRFRRRLKALQRELNPEITEITESGDGSDSDPEQSEDTRPELFHSHVRLSLAGRLRHRLAGRKALFVSNRTDRELEARLQEALGLELTWSDGSPRRLESAASSVGDGGYDLVMVATGFQSHAADGLLSKAAKKAGVPYVRVYKGRPKACFRALARTFGVAGASAAREA